MSTDIYRHIFMCTYLYLYLFLYIYIYLKQSTLTSQVRNHPPHLGMDTVVTSRSLGGVMISTLTWNVRDVGSISDLDRHLCALCTYMCIYSVVTHQHTTCIYIYIYIYKYIYKYWCASQWQGFTFWQHLKSHHDRYRLVRIHIHHSFLVLPPM